MSLVQPLIAIEVGNTHAKFGVFLQPITVTPGRLPVCDHLFTAPVTADEFPWSELRAASGTAPRCVIASVNPPALEGLLKEWPATGWPAPHLLTNNSELPVGNQTQFPDRVGKDRLLKAIAGNILRVPGQPLILIDSGTATTVDWVTSNGEFSGGAILPGLKLSAQALHDHTAQLPLIPLEHFHQTPPPVIGKDTQSALQSGIYWGHVGAVRELIQRLSAEHPGEIPSVLITGGGGEILARELGLPTSFYRDLTLQGLAVAANFMQMKNQLKGP